MRAHRDESGSGLTEFVIVAPLFIVLVYWSQFFVDLGILKIKSQEAARFALWEMTAQRDVAKVRADLTAKYQDLSSPDARAQTTRPFGTRSFPKPVTVTATSFNDQVDAPFRFTKRPESPGGGFMAEVQAALNKVINTVVDAAIKAFGFESAGAASVTVRMESDVALFPKGSILGIPLGPQLTKVAVTTKSPTLVINTWKAWPGKFGDAGMNSQAGGREASPGSTYGAPSPAERIVSVRAGRMATFGDFMGKVNTVVNKVIKFLGLPGFMLTGTWADGEKGPIAMFPGARYSNAWSPGRGKAIQRLGDVYLTSEAKTVNVDSPSRSYTDRARFTTPGVAMNSDYWRKGGKARGGEREGPFNNTVVKSGWDFNGSNSSKNPYKKSYACRDGYYMGTMKGQNARWGGDMKKWVNAGFGSTCR